MGRKFRAAKITSYIAAVCFTILFVVIWPGSMLTIDIFNFTQFNAWTVVSRGWAFTATAFNVLGNKGQRIRELTSVVQKRFNYPDGAVELYAEKVATRGLCAIAQAESLRYKLIGGLAVRRACYGVLRFIMESGAKGCEVVVSG